MHKFIQCLLVPNFGGFGIPFQHKSRRSLEHLIHLLINIFNCHLPDVFLEQFHLYFPVAMDLSSIGGTFRDSS